MDAPGCDPDAPFDDTHPRRDPRSVLFASRSDIVLVPIHDVFGWRERINTPAVIDDATGPGACPGRSTIWKPSPPRRERAEFLSALTQQTQRW